MRGVFCCCAAAVILLSAVPIAAGHETDQFEVPPNRQFADLGDYFNRWACEAITRGVNSTNSEIRKALSAHRSAGALAELQSAPHITLAVRNQWPWSVTEIENVETVLRSRRMRQRYPGLVVAYGERFSGVYEFAFIPIDIRMFGHLLFFSSTIKVYGTYLGTDKLGHFTDEGISYYFAYRDARDAGASEHDAIARAVRVGTDGLMSERGMLGLLANADYANGDVAANFAGFLFYRNLTEPMMLKGRLRPPLLRRDGAYWKISEDVRPRSGFFARFISDHLDEALNPGYFDPLVRPGLRLGVRLRTQTILQHYCDEHGVPHSKQWFDRKLRELSTYWGVDYGHLGSYDELVSIGSECFGAGANPPDSDDRGARTASALLRHRAPATAANNFGRTPLHLAAAGRRVAATAVLRAAGACPDATDHFGRTPLHDAVRAGATGAALAGDGIIIGILLDHGADPRVRDERGRTPADVASLHQFPDLAVRLNSAWRRRNGGFR